MEVWPIAVDVAHSVVLCVCLSVCLCLGHISELCKNGWTDRDAIWAADSCWFKEPCIRWGSRSAHATGHCWGVMRPFAKLCWTLVGVVDMELSGLWSVPPVHCAVLTCPASLQLHTARRPRRQHCVEVSSARAPCHEHCPLQVHHSTGRSFTYLLTVLYRSVTVVVFFLHNPQWSRGYILEVKGQGHILVRYVVAKASASTLGRWKFIV